MEMSDFPLTGGCNCEAVRFEVTEPSLTDIFIEAVGKISLPDAPSTLSA